MFSVLKEKIEWAVSLPYTKKLLPKIVYGRDSNEDINKFLTQVRRKLDENLYGMDNIKDELISILNDRITNPKAISTLALKSSPGTGKTAIASALAEAVGLPFERIALGGMTDSTTLKGADSHWLGSGPSILLHILKKMGISNGVVLLDEIDKLSASDTKGANMQNALLHITDYTQNHQFGDAFVNDIPHDLSNIWFIYAMNDEKLLDPILRDRLTILEVEPYTPADFKEITKRHLLPKALENVSIPKELVTITDGACSVILSILADQIKETGVRPIQRLIRCLASRINRLRTTTLSDGTTGNLNTRISLPGFKLPLVIDENVVKKLIDPPKKSAPLSYFL
jgi:ATP-dependent Lon protease